MATSQYVEKKLNHAVFICKQLTIIRYILPIINILFIELIYTVYYLTNVIQNVLRKTQL
jgi:hypothetical protein